MIEATSITNMFKAYTPLEMAKAMGERKEKETGIMVPVLPITQLDMWSNGRIAVFAYDPLPKSLVTFGSTPSDTLITRCATMADECTTKAWPVLMGHVQEHKDLTDEQKAIAKGITGMSLVKFDVEGSDCLVYDGRYIAFLLNRAKKAKTIEWYASTKNPYPIKLVVDGKITGLLTPINFEKAQKDALDNPSIFEWRFVNPDIETPFLSPVEEQDFIDHEDANTPEQTANDYAKAQTDAYQEPEVEVITVTNPFNGNESAATIDEKGMVVIEDPAFFETVVEGKTPGEMVEVILAKSEEILAKVEVEEPAPFDVDGSEYGKAISKARKVKVTDQVIGGLVTQKGIVTISNVATGKRDYEPDPDAWDKVCETLPEDAFYLGMWVTSQNTKPGKAHFALAQEVWNEGGPGILVVTEKAIFGIGKDERSNAPDKIKVIFEVER